MNDSHVSVASRFIRTNDKKFVHLKMDATQFCIQNPLHLNPLPILWGGGRGEGCEEVKWAKISSLH